MLSLIRRMFGASHPDGVPPQSPEHGLPIGVFRICPRGEHVMQVFDLRCPGCLEAEDRGAPAATAPNPPPAPVAVQGGQPTMSLPHGSPPFFQGIGPLVPPDPAPASPKGRPAPVRQTEVFRVAPEDERTSSQPWGRLVLDLELLHPVVRVGADPSVELHLSALGVLGHHLTLRFEAGQASVQPGASGASITLNGRRLSQVQPLRHGDKVTVGGLHFRFELLGPN